MNKERGIVASLFVLFFNEFFGTSGGINGDRGLYSLYSKVKLIFLKILSCATYFQMLY